ncbi:GNAT family N-acetyltransferase [Kribbella sp. NPDC026611]|uniref:GNAT family N-acetyltransferase n=1 Tax=Kribbella sp. NPDC026611 TaxID=3154911 RepID=UPI0033EC1BB5
MTAINLRLVTDRAELTDLAPLVADMEAAWAPSHRQESVREARLEVYRRFATSDDFRNPSAMVAETTEGRLVGVRMGSRPRGPQSVWTSPGAGELRVPGRGVIGAETRAYWDRQPVPHGIILAVDPEYQQQGIGRRVMAAWGAARPADERYATGHLQPDSVPPLSTVARLGGQIIGEREDGRYFYLLPLRGQSADEVSQLTVAIQQEVPSVDTALRGVASTLASARAPVALPMTAAIERAVAIKRHALDR